MTHYPSRNSEAFALLVAEIYDAAGVLRRYGEGIAASAGQTQARWQLLSVVSDGNWTVPTAADRLGTSRQAVQRIANDLVTDGLAALADNPRHSRSPFLRLTPEGRRVLAAISEQARRRHSLLLSRLNHLELSTLRPALRELTSVVRLAIESEGRRR